MLLRHRLRSGPISEDAPVSHLNISHAATWYLPSPFTPFFGRESELALLDQHLKDPLTRLVTIVGVGGIGKTRLVLRAAQEHQRFFADGVGIVPLTAISTRDGIVFAIAEALGQTFIGSGEPQDQRLRCLRG